MNRLGLWGIFLTLLSLGLFTSCDVLHDGERPLAGTNWTLLLLNGQPLANRTITLDFEEIELSGFAGCNQYGGPYSASFTGSFSIAEIAQTAQHCLEPPGIMDQESSYVEAFLEARVYRIRDDRLELSDAERQPILVFERQ